MPRMKPNALYSVERGDALAWLRAQPDDSIDLLFTSPPYELARTYGIAHRMVGGQAWVNWMVAVVSEAAPKVTGLIAINCEGQTDDYRYSCVPFLLVADLHRAGFNLRKPPIFQRVGIPGSGGPDWLRNDYEPIVCITRPGQLPHSDNTACGHTPKYALGGAMSYRNGDGVRKNARDQLGRRFRHDREGRVKGSHARDVCAIANPGNRIEQTYTASEVARLLEEAGDVRSHKVGGGLMGHHLAHENEAPFPLDLPAFFVRSFCPPSGTVADPFCGSGTVLHAAVLHGRIGLGCDLRQSQVTLTRRRLKTVQPLEYLP